MNEQGPKLNPNPGFSTAEKNDLFAQLQNEGSISAPDNSSSEDRDVPPPLPDTPPVPPGPEPVPPIPPIDSILPDQLPAYIATIKGQTDALLKQTAELQKQNEASGARIELLIKQISSTREILQELRQLREGGVVKKKTDTPAPAPADTPKDALKIVPPPLPALDTKPADVPGAVKDDLLNAALDALGAKDALMRDTLKNTFLAFPNDDEDSKKIRAAIASRRWSVWKEGERKTSVDDMRSVGEAMLRFQKMPLWQRAGLGESMSYALAGSGAAAWASYAFFGCMAPPLALAGAAGLGFYKHMKTLLERENMTGRGRSFMHKNPGASAAVVGALSAGSIVWLSVPGNAQYVANVFDKLASGVSTALRPLLQVFSSAKIPGASITIGI